MYSLKRMASRLPAPWQQELKRIRYRRQIRNGRFMTMEPEFALLDQLVTAGDWVIDIGACIGHYTKRASDLVGPAGRVIAVEPVPATFALLAANVLEFRHRNVTLLNVAASNRTAEAGMKVPSFATGLHNYYEASLVAEDADFTVVTIAIDGLALHHRVALVKIDAEGHDEIVLNGLRKLVARDHPAVILETRSTECHDELVEMGYSKERLRDSPNTLFRWSRG